MCGRAVANHYGHFARIQVELLASYVIVLQDALSEVMKIYPPLKLRVFVGDITALVKGRDTEVAGQWQKS